MREPTATSPSPSTKLLAALPFQFVQPTETERYDTCVPLIDLEVAANGWSDEQEQTSPRWLRDWEENWVTWPGAPRFHADMFVARVEGKAMEPRIPAGSWCLFRPAPAGSLQGRCLLLWNAGTLFSPLEGGHFVVGEFSSEKEATDDSWTRTRVTLTPANEDIEPLLLDHEEAPAVRVIAAFAQIVGAAAHVKPGARLQPAQE